MSAVGCRGAAPAEAQKADVRFGEESGRLSAVAGLRSARAVAVRDHELESGRCCGVAERARFVIEEESGSLLGERVAARLLSVDVLRCWRAAEIEPEQGLCAEVQEPVAKRRKELRGRSQDEVEHSP